MTPGEAADHLRDVQGLEDDAAERFDRELEGIASDIDEAGRQLLRHDVQRHSSTGLGFVAERLQQRAEDLRTLAAEVERAEAGAEPKQYLVTITAEDGDVVFEQTVSGLSENQVAQVAAMVSERDKGDDSPEASR